MYILQLPTCHDPKHRFDGYENFANPFEFEIFKFWNGISTERLEKFCQVARAKEEIFAFAPRVRPAGIMRQSETFYCGRVSGVCIPEHLTPNVVLIFFFCNQCATTKKCVIANHLLLRRRKNLFDRRVKILRANWYPLKYNIPNAQPSSNYYTVFLRRGTLGMSARIQ